MLRHWWALVIGFAFGGIGAILIVWPGVRIPWILLAAIPMAGLLVAGFLAFHGLYSRLLAYSEIEQILTEIGDIRAHGIDLISKGIGLGSLPEVERWMTEVDEWYVVSKKKVQQLSPSEASVFGIGDPLRKPVAFAAVNLKHREYLNTLTQRTEALKDLVGRFSRQSLQSKLTLG